MNGTDKDVWDTAVKDVPLEVQGHSMKLDFHVMHMSRADVVLGREWLHGLGSSLTRSYQHNTLAFEDNGVHVLLLGEKEVLQSPLICNAEVTFLSKNNAIESLYLCYFSSPCLLTNELMNGIEVSDNIASSSTGEAHSLSSLVLKESFPSL